MVYLKKLYKNNLFNVAHKNKSYISLYLPPSDATAENLAVLIIFRRLVTLVQVFIKLLRQLMNVKEVSIRPHIFTVRRERLSMT